MEHRKYKAHIKFNVDKDIMRDDRFCFLMVIVFDKLLVKLVTLLCLMALPVSKGGMEGCKVERVVIWRWR
jgi:hypothetical protein